MELIRRATETVRAGNDLTGNGHFYALFLLTEFRAKEALPTILDAISLPNEGPFELFGDAITEDLARILAELIGDRLEILEGLIANRSLNEYVRWEGARTYLYLVGAGRMTREEAVEHLRRHLVDAIANRDEIAATGLVAELVSYAPHEAVEEIREAFRKELVDEGYVGWNTVEKSIAEGESGLQRELGFRRSSRIVDTVQELRGWASCSGARNDFGYEDDSNEEYDEEYAEGFRRLEDALTMPRRDEWLDTEAHGRRPWVRRKT